MSDTENTKAMQRKREAEFAAAHPDLYNDYKDAVGRKPKDIGDEPITSLTFGVDQNGKATMSYQTLAGAGNFDANGRYEGWVWAC